MPEVFLNEYTIEFWALFTTGTGKYVNITKSDLLQNLTIGISSSFYPYVSTQIGTFTSSKKLVQPGFWQVIGLSYSNIKSLSKFSVDQYLSENVLSVMFPFSAGDFTFNSGDYLYISKLNFWSFYKTQAEIFQSRHRRPHISLSYLSLILYFD